VAGVLLRLPVFDKREFIDFLESLKEMLWRWRNKAQGGELTVPLTVNAEQGAAMEAWGAERHSAPFLCLKNLFQQRDKNRGCVFVLQYSPA